MYTSLIFLGLLLLTIFVPYYIGKIIAYEDESKIFTWAVGLGILAIILCALLAIMFLFHISVKLTS